MQAHKQEFLFVWLCGDVIGMLTGVSNPPSRDIKRLYDSKFYLRFHATGLASGSRNASIHGGIG